MSEIDIETIDRLILFLGVAIENAQSSLKQADKIWKELRKEVPEERLMYEAITSESWQELK